MIPEKGERIDILEGEVLPRVDRVSDEELAQIKEGVVLHMKENSGQREVIRRRKVLKAAAAAAVILVALPSTVYAAGKVRAFFQSEVKEEGYQVAIDLQKPSVTPKEMSTGLGMLKASGEPRDARLVCGEIGGYTVKQTGNGWYSFLHEDGFSAGREFDCELIQVDQTVDKELFVRDVSEWEEIEVSGHKALYLKINGIVGSQYSSDTDYGQKIYIFYEDAGYIIQVYAMDGIVREELLRYVSGIRLEEGEHSGKDDYQTLSEYLKNNSLEAGEDTDTSEFLARVNRVQENQIAAVNETVTFDGIEYQVQEVQVMDSIAAVLGESRKNVRFSMNLWQRHLKFSDKDGRLKSYKRETLEYGDGIHAPEARVIGSEEIAQRFVLVTLRVKNTTEHKETVEVCRNMSYLEKKDGEYGKAEEPYNRPEIIEDCQIDRMPQYFRETDGGQGFYMKTLDAGEEEVYHMGYFVDEDLTGKMYLSVDDGSTSGDGFEGWKIDISE